MHFLKKISTPLVVKLSNRSDKLPNNSYLYSWPVFFPWKYKINRQKFVDPFLQRPKYLQVFSN